MTRVLALDDDEDLNILIAMVLVRAGYDVDAVHSGAAAIAALGATTYDLALLDWNMASPDGLAVCRALRADPRQDGCAVVMLSACDDPREIERVLAGGADEYLCKPFPIRELAAHVERVVAQRQRAVLRQDAG